MKAVEEQGAGAPVGGCQPFLQFANQPAGNIDAPHLIALGIDILVAGVDILNLKGNQLADAHPCGCYEPHDEIIGILLTLRQAPLQIFIVSLADNLIQICFLLNLNHGNGGDGGLPVFHVAVQRPDAQVHGLGPVMFQKIYLIKLEVAGGQLGIQMIKLFYRIAVYADGIWRFVMGHEIFLKLVQCMIGR